MADRKKAILELKKIVVELNRLVQRVENLELELAEAGSVEDQKLRLYKAVKLLCFKTGPDVYLLQSEIFGFIGAMLPHCPPLQEACERMGWLDGKPSNVFWRGFWPWLAAQEGIQRVVLSKNDIRFFGVKKVFWDGIPRQVIETALSVLEDMDDNS